MGNNARRAMQGLMAGTADRLRRALTDGFKTAVRTTSANAAAIAHALRRESWPEPAEADLSLAKARLSGTNLEDGMRIMPVAGLLLTIVYSMWHPLLPIVLWFCAFLAAWGLHWVIKPILANATRETARWALGCYRAQNIFFVAVWGAQAWLFWIPGDPVNHMIISAVILASTIGAIMSSAWAPTAALQIVAYIGSSMALFAMEGTGVDMMMVGLAFIFGVFVAGTSARMHQTTHHLLRLESDKDALIDSLRASDRAKSEFLANMSHELRTPLNAILGFSEVMQMEVLGALGNPKYRAYAGDIHTSGAHLLSLINDILDLAKIEAGKVELTDDTFRLSELASVTMSLFRVQAEQGGIEIRSDIGPDPQIRWDLRSAKQIAFNLVSNAVKFTPRGGSITVGTAWNDEGWLRIWVKDSGRGIAPEDQRKVFQSFGQGRHDVTPTEKGTGLGLAIALGLVELHGGRIELESTLGVGTTVTVLVPPSRIVAEPKAIAA